MKKLLNSVSTLMVIVFFAFSFSSCDKQACYECEPVNQPDPSYGLNNGFSGCVGEDVAGITEISALELEIQVDVHESQGGFCRKL